MSYLWTNTAKTVTFSYETKDKLYDAIVHPDGTVTYAVNCKPVDALPDTSATRKLHGLVGVMKPKAVELLMDGPGSEVEKERWWAIRDYVRAYKG